MIHHLRQRTGAPIALNAGLWLLTASPLIGQMVRQRTQRSGVKWSRGLNESLRVVSSPRRSEHYEPNTEVDQIRQVRE